MTGATAGLVAIIGGLLVSKFIGLDSEQQGAQRLLADARARLAIARRRTQDAQDTFLHFEAAELTSDRDVIRALLDGVSGVAELRRRAELEPTSWDDQLQSYVEEAHQEAQRALAALDEYLPDAEERTAEEWRLHLDWWELKKQDGVPRVERDDIWAEALSRLVARRRVAVKEREREERRALRRLGLPQIPTFGPTLDPGDFIEVFTDKTPRVQVSLHNAQIAARRRDELRSAVDRAQQRVEDIELEVERHTQIRDAVVKPSWQLPIGLSVLVFATIVGIMLPVLAMMHPSGWLAANTPWLVLAFFSGLVVLLGYMVTYAGRLSLRRSLGEKHGR